MYILEVLFSVSPVIGFALCLFILLKKEGIGNYKKAKCTLATLVFIYAIYVLDNFLVFKGHVFLLSGIPYLLYHFIGFLLYYFISEITGEKSRLAFWRKVFFVITLIRWPFFGFIASEYPELLAHIELLKSSPIWGGIIIDSLLTVILNLVLVLESYKLFKTTPLVIQFGNKGEIQYRWVNFMFVTNIVLMGLSLLNTLGGLFNIYSIEFSIQIDLIMYSLFFFVLVYSLMSFPVFAFTGHFNDLETEVKQKYTKSTLQDSEEVFLKVDHLIKSETLFLDSTLKMNTLVEKTNISLPHISQAINENTQMSFSDYINAFRVEEAKQKLLEENPDKIIAIAYDVGFNSKATFYSAFKKFTQTTPTNFIKEHKSKVVL